MLRLTNIGKRFPNGTLVFEGINLEIAPRTIVSIVGPSGEPLAQEVNVFDRSMVTRQG
jgi:ABC-type phosphate/phosphonate transport system ATPase subunit